MSWLGFIKEAQSKDRSRTVLRSHVKLSNTEGNNPGCDNLSIPNCELLKKVNPVNTLCYLS